MFDDKFSRVKNEVKKTLKHPDQSDSHRWPHTKQVMQNSMFLAEKASAIGLYVELEDLILSVLGHDLIQHYQVDKAEHVKNSIEVYKTILKKNGYTEEKIKKILGIMSEHSSEVINPPSTTEAIILYIADKWNGIGKEGVRRALAYGKQRKMTKKETVQWYKEKIEKAKPLFLELIKKIPGSEITLKDLRYSLEYIEKFEKKRSKQAV
jgi:HD superfamily phosphodiesterase